HHRRTPTATSTIPSPSKSPTPANSVAADAVRGLCEGTPANTDLALTLAWTIGLLAVFMPLTLAVVSSPTDTIQQLARYVAAISSHGHTLQTHHDLPPELRQQLSAFDDEHRP
ncbi:MAG: hypothetical protein GY926_01855, partial [bacterium]|nr:hypothetical protein [bacterium]